MDAPAAPVRPAASTPLGVWLLLAGGVLVVLGAALVVLVRVLRRRRRVRFAV
ncbi:hypothetical protein HC031_31725 [Planosporangium thailandense]|uniref:LPXTG cell wall anchor domain-containing protein n=1 Tax=Planosporangium thailandense TaxID=765197 RepID=A0ABX0Y747_9ACTN|nr:hypothetical protein [Planosporangium thailandense]NJC74250.1 hypothetical protein [Planosporangium thailandense]